MIVYWYGTRVTISCTWFMLHDFSAILIWLPSVRIWLVSMMPLMRFMFSIPIRRNCSNLRSALHLAFNWILIFPTTRPFTLFICRPIPGELSISQIMWTIVSYNCPLKLVSYVPLPVGWINSKYWLSAFIVSSTKCNVRWFAFSGIGLNGVSATRLSYPNCLKFDAYHNLYVVDTMNNRIQRFLLLHTGC